MKNGSKSIVNGFIEKDHKNIIKLMYKNNKGRKSKISQIYRRFFIIN